MSASILTCDPWKPAKNKGAKGAKAGRTRTSPRRSRSSATEKPRTTRPRRATKPRRTSMRKNPLDTHLKTLLETVAAAPKGTDADDEAADGDSSDYYSSDDDWSYDEEDAAYELSAAATQTGSGGHHGTATLEDYEEFNISPSGRMVMSHGHSRHSIHMVDVPRALEYATGVPVKLYLTREQLAMTDAARILLTLSDA